MTRYNKINDRNLILEDIKRVARQLNTDSLSTDQYERYGNYSNGPLKRIFGSESKAFESAGLNHYYPIKDQELINDIKSVAKKLDVSYLIRKEYQKYGKYSISSIYYRFKGWINVLKICGLNIQQNKRFKYSSKQLLQFLKHYYQRFNHIPTRRDMEKATQYGYPCDKVYYSVFNKSWGEILKLAGLDIKSKIFGMDGNLYDSKTEASIANILHKNFINYESHKRVCDDRKWTCDFYLPDQNLWIEYDGLGKYRRRAYFNNDKIQYYKDHNFNYIILNHENEVLNQLNLCLSGEIIIQSIPYHICKEFLLRNHYLKNIPKNYQIILGGFIQSKLVSVCMFGKIANPNESNLILSRFCYLDLVRGNKNYGSHFMSLCLKYLKKSGFKGQIVSWSDPRFHNGTLYKACNFKEIETSSKKDYIYIDQYGNEYHKSKCRVKSGNSESKRAEELGLIKLIIPSKIKWEIIIS